MLLSKVAARDHIKVQRADCNSLIGNDANIVGTVEYLMECTLIRREVEFFVLKLDNERSSYCSVLMPSSFHIAKDSKRHY